MSNALKQKANRFAQQLYSALDECVLSTQQHKFHRIVEEFCAHVTTQLNTCLTVTQIDSLKRYFHLPQIDIASYTETTLTSWDPAQTKPYDVLCVASTMDEGTPPRQMSLIPYAQDANREVVLRRGNAVVLLDPHSRQLSVSETGDNALELTECPYCHRPWIDDPPSSPEYDNDEHERGRTYASNRAFVDPDYFGMLAASQRPTPTGSRSSTPSTFSRRLFVPALRSGRSRDVSGSSQTPPNAQFVASEPSPPSGEGISSSAFSPGFFRQFFVEQGELGRGGNGVVLLVEHIMDRVSLGHFACKRVPVGNDHSWLEKVLVEVKLLQKIPHKNLVAYHWVWLEDHQPSKFGPSIPCLWILQEYCNGGDLHNFVLGPHKESDTKESLKQRLRRRSKGESERPSDIRGPSSLTFDEIFSFFRDITSGLHHLHRKGYIHRDLKPHNCLLQRDGTKTRVLISDFGEVQAAGDKRGSTGATGTISYCAPEVLRQEGLGGAFGNFTTKSDIFSLGMTVYFMCFGRLPYRNSDDVMDEVEDLDELRAEITNWEGFGDQSRLRPDLPEKLYRFLKRLLSVDPNERPSTEEILNSIKGGASMGEPAAASAPDEPFRPVLMPRKSSVRLSSVSRPHSGDFVRSKSPPKAEIRGRHQSTSQPSSPMNASFLIQRQRVRTDIPRSDREDARPRPPLMLPPPDSVSHTVWRFLEQPSTTLAIRGLLFLAKLLSVNLPCSPYAANPWLLYPLFALAALDVGILPFDPGRTLIMAAFHLTIVIFAHQQDGLCAGKTVFWNSF